MKRDELAKLIFDAMTKRGNELEPGGVPDASDWDESGHDGLMLREFFLAGADAVIAGYVPQCLQSADEVVFRDTKLLRDLFQERHDAHKAEDDAHKESCKESCKMLAACTSVEAINRDMKIELAVAAIRKVQDRIDDAIAGMTLEAIIAARDGKG